MKRRAFVCLILVLVLLVSACTTPAPPEPAPPADTPAPATPAPTPAPVDVDEDVVEGSPFLQEMVIAHLPKTVGGAWYTRKFSGVGQYGGMTGSAVFQMGPTAGDAAQQNRFVEDVIVQGVDAILISPFAPEQTDAVLGQAMDAGIIVVSTEGQHMQNMNYNVEAFNHGAFGTNAAQLLAGGMDEEGEILIFVGSLGSTAHVGWATAIVEAVDRYFPNMSIANPDLVFIETGNNAPQAFERAREAFLAHPNARGAFSPSATDTPAIARAIEELGLVGQVTYVAVGLPNASRTYVTSGAIDYLMSWDPADFALAMAMVAGAVRAGVSLQTGDDLGVFGFNSIVVEGNNITGTEWRVINAANVGNFHY